MSLDAFMAVVQGYTDRLLDQQILAVQTGYWAAYYTGSKHPKSVQQLAEDMVRKHQRKQDAADMSIPRPEVDVNAFLEKEAKFKAKLAEQGR